MELYTLKWKIVHQKSQIGSLNGYWVVSMYFF
jgi:hypothetical protein